MKLIRIWITKRLIAILWWLAKKDIIFDLEARYWRWVAYRAVMAIIYLIRPTTGIGGDVDLSGVYGVKDYPITLGFDAVYQPYYPPGDEHHGIDYGTPTGTQVVVANQVIAVTNNTGQSTGPHIHIDKRKGTGNYVNPSDWDTIEGVVTQVGNAGTAGIMITINATNGYNYRFLHLKETFVKVGDELIMSRPVTSAELNQLVWRYYGREPNNAEKENWTGKTFDWVYDRCNGNETWQDTMHKIRNYDEDCEGNDDNYVIPKDNVLAEFEDKYL